MNGSVSNSGRSVEKFNLGKLDTIEKQNSKDLGSMERKQGRIQIIDRSQIKSLLIHIKDMLIDGIEKILLPSKDGSESAFVKVRQNRMIAIDGIKGIMTAGGRQIIRFSDSSRERSRRYGL